MTVHACKHFRITIQVSVASLAGNQKLERVLDVDLVLTFQVGMARPQKSEGRQRRNSGIGVTPGTFPIMAQGSGLLPRLASRGVPAAVGRLLAGQPLQRRTHPLRPQAKWPQLPTPITFQSKGVATVVVNVATMWW